MLSFIRRQFARGVSIWSRLRHLHNRYILPHAYTPWRRYFDSNCSTSTRQQSSSLYLFLRACKMVLLKILAVAVPLLCLYLYRKLRWHRFERFKGIPQPQADLIWGHMKLMNDMVNEPGDTPGMHSDYAFKKLVDRNGQPDMLLVDVWPAQAKPIVVINSPFVAEQITKPSKDFKYSLPKSPTVAEFHPAVGIQSMLAQDGHQWKTLRKQFNPGFAPRHLITLLPAIMDKTRRFINRLDSKCVSGEVFSLDDMFIRLTFDIIGAVTMDLDFNVQGSPVHPIADEMLKLLKTFTAGSEMAGLSPLVRRKRWQAGRATDVVLKQEIKHQFHELRATDPYSETQRAKSVLALALQDKKELTEEALQDANDQIKTFLLAGHDTTAILLSWALYSLSLHPKALETACKELDQVFGPSTEPEHVMKMLLEGGEDVLRKLPYISAIIKETLRLHPPAGSARMAPAGSNIVLTMESGERICVDGMVLYICPYVLQRNKKYYGETADDFVPERWIGNTDTSASTNEDEAHTSSSEKSSSGIPAYAWRPFERGPRNCIGQELANIEARVILAIVLRRYRFDKVGVGQPKVDEKGQKILNAKGEYEVESVLVNRRQITLKPLDGMQMKVRLASAV